MAHPRSRGENDYYPTGATLREGSSPLTRGKLVTATISILKLRLIPAHAGTTVSVRGGGWVAGAHPRSRGENFPASWSMLVPPGSSPLTRGKLTGTFAVREPVGLIPAHAGKTPCARRPRASRRAHPRSRGENTIAFDREKAARGSSPLTRGKPCEGLGTDLSRGLIPAHAGKTCAFRLWGPSPRAHPRSRGENN